MPLLRTKSLCFMRALLWWFALLCGVQGQAWASRVAVPVDGRLTTMPLSGFLHASPVGATYASAHEALESLRANQFEHLPGYLGRGYAQGVIWLGFDLALGEDVPRILIVDVGPAYLDEVRAYQADSAGRITPLGRAGDQVPTGEVFMPALRPAFAFQPANGHTLLLEIRTTSTKAAIVKLHSEGRFPVLQSAEGLLYGSVLAVNLIMVMVALVLFRLFRDRAYLVWMAYVFLSGTQYMALGGVLGLYAEWGDRAYLNLITNAISVMLFAFGALLMTVVFQFRDIHPWLHRLHVGWAVMMVLPLMATPIWGAPVVGSMAMLGTPIYLVGIACIGIQIARGHRASVLYGPMFIVHLVMSLINVLAILGWISFSDFTFFAWQLTSLLNLLSLQTGMFMRVRDQLAETARERRHYLRALNNRNAELEQQVAARTASLARALQEVQQAELAQRQLLSMASHEFRTPAAMISTSIDSLRFLADRIPPEVAKRLTNIQHATSRLIDLSNNLIEQDRLRERSLQPKLASVDLLKLMSDVVSRYASDGTASERLPVLLEVSPCVQDRERLVVKLDAVLVSVALHNLIDNALQHGRSPGADAMQSEPVRVRVELVGDCLDMSVADRGPGIPDEEKVRVFERFYSQASRSSAKATIYAQSYGDGLGLAIVQTIARAHGGEAYAADHAGGGAVLGIRLPMIP